MDGPPFAEGAELARAPPPIPPMASAVVSSNRVQAHAQLNRNTTCRQAINNSDGYEDEDEDDFYGAGGGVDADEPLLCDNLVLEDQVLSRNGDLNMINLAEIGEDRSRVPQPGKWYKWF